MNYKVNYPFKKGSLILECGITECKGEIFARCDYCHMPLCKIHSIKVESEDIIEHCCNECYLCFCFQQE